MSDRLQITPGETLDVIERTPDLLVFDARWSPGGHPPPAHFHPTQDEHFEVLEGTLSVDVAGTLRRLQPGEIVDIPRRTPHRMWNPESQPARARWETRPAGRTESWFAALAGLQGTEHVDAAGTPKALPFAALAHEYRDTVRLVVGPPLIGGLALAALAAIARVTGRRPAVTANRAA